MEYNDWLEDAWDRYQDAYFKWCDQNGLQADLSAFQIWLEDQDLIPEPIYE